MNSYEYNTPAHERRIGYTDRDKCVDFLAERVASGHLTTEEFAERRDRALLATRQGELDALTRDIPPLPEKPVEKYKTQVAGNAYPFSMRRWIGSLIIGASLIVLPCPIWSGAAGGFRHVPGDGVAAVILILVGVIITLFCGLGFMPDGDEPVRNRTIKNGTPGGRNY